MLTHQKVITEDKERIDKISKISFDKLYTYNDVIHEVKNESFTNTNTNFYNQNFNEEKFSKRVRK